MKYILFLAGLLILIGVEIARVYYIMPFPGSQEDNTIQLAYFIGSYIWYFRGLGVLLIAYPAFLFLTKSSFTIKSTAVALLLFWVVVAYAFNFRFLAEKMFYQPEHKILVKTDKNKIEKNQLVIGVTINGESKAYPIEIIGYHHQVRDTVGGESIMVTYCTVCRTGRVYKPMVDGVTENFRLVGMDHYNAMFEDSRTKSWWRQVNGEAITGSLKGKFLPEIPSEQMALGVWLLSHPDSYILQKDSAFNKQYDELKDYDEGKTKGRLEKKDSLSWKDKSWVVGIVRGQTAKAYDWNDLLNQKVINDVVENFPVVVSVEMDSASFHVWSRVIGKDTLQFSFDVESKSIKDQKGGTWNWQGQCIEGDLKEASLTLIQSYQEYWHSWRTFHPQTQKYTKP
ncbi:MAG TPA: hypothetical protein DGG95_02450 [Cytophagales bacterium]|jgi:hypothetical protein|nr:hypothetical protein [Cytophagales bacterium]